jgi:hypothetical protein
MRQEERARARIAELRERIAAFDYVCSGTLTHRTTRCGKPNCRCQQDPSARHGPYYDWTRLERGKLAHRMLSPEQATMVRSAIANFREIRALLSRWERETLRAAGVRPTKKT